MHANEPTPLEEFVETYIAGMPWTDETPEEVRELVRQNVRMFAYCLSRRADRILRLLRPGAGEVGQRGGA